MFSLDTGRAREGAAFVFAETGFEVNYGELSRHVNQAKSVILAEMGLFGDPSGGRRVQPITDPLTEFKPLTPRPTLDSLIELLAHLELGIPALLLDARSPSAERERVLGEARGKSPQPGDRVVLSTSGSTGRPKLVVHTEASLLAAARASEKNLGWLPDGDRWHLALPLCHVGGLALVVRAVLARQTLVVGSARSSDPEALVSELKRHRVTLASFVPTQLGRVLPHVPRKGLPSLRAVLVGGAPTAPELREQAAERSVRLLTTYGMTEMSSQVATQRWETSSEGAALVLGASERPPIAASNALGSTLDDSGLVGPPLPGVQLRFDAEGRISVFGPMAMRGYLNAPSPFDADGYLITSDLGHLDRNGNLHVLGRIDNVILTGGENVSPESVEAALLSLPRVREACVFGVTDPDWGSRVVAALVVDGDLSVEEVRAGAARLLPSFAIPKEFGFAPSLPNLPSGKLDRAQVRLGWLSGDVFRRP